MAGSFWLGMGIILLCGVFNGTFALPMNYSRCWRWENTWLWFSFLSLLILPWVLAIAFVPHLWFVYASSASHVLLFPLGFGLLLGIAQVTYGLGIASVGIAVAITIVAGVSCVCGALVPLLVLQPSDLLRTRGILLLVSIAILLTGLALYGVAGRRRENEQSGAKPRIQVFPWGFRSGLAICIFTGVFGSSVNLGFAFSGGIIRKSIELGGNSVTSTYAVWALLFGASFIPNLGYCSFLLFRNHGWSLFLGKGRAKEMSFATGMALLSLGGFIGYGIGAMVVGKYGTSAGWALFVAATIIASSLAGLVIGEWKGTSHSTRRLLFAAVTVILASVLSLALGGLF